MNPTPKLKSVGKVPHSDSWLAKGLCNMNVEASHGIDIHLAQHMSIVSCKTGQLDCSYSTDLEIRSWSEIVVPGEMSNSVVVAELFHRPEGLLITTAYSAPASGSCHLSAPLSLRHTQDSHISLLHLLSHWIHRFRPLPAR